MHICSTTNETVEENVIALTNEFDFVCFFVTGTTKLIFINQLLQQCSVNFEYLNEE